MKKRIFLKILLLAGVMIGLIGCGEKRGSRDWIENKVAEVSRVYPTENLFDLFKQFPDGFKIKQSFKDGAYIIHVELVATSKGDPIIGTISKVENKSREKIFEANFQYQDGKYQFANEADAAYWPYRGFLFEKLTLNRDILSKLDLQEKSYNMMNGDFELRYKVTNEIINSFLELGDSDSLSVSLGGSNSNRGYYYSIMVKNGDGLLFIETVSD